jgi:Xaa-Pro aminopeptidase
MLAAQEPACRAAAGRRRSEGERRVPAPIEEAGLGEHFRHRMGHGIGMDVHERPFISTETRHRSSRDDVHRRAVDHHPRRFSVRIEDIVVCEEGGGRKLNALSPPPSSRTR